MPDASLLDVESLLAAIPGDKPAGDATAYPYRLREQLTDLRQEERPEDFDDATRPAQLKRADYASIIRIATDALTKQVKDLRLACHLIEALAKTRGFAGLGDGLCLLKRMLSECWDRLEPAIDDGDLDSRSSPVVNLLDDPDRGFCFPNTVRAIPIFAGQSVLSWQKALAKKSPDDERTVTQVQAKATVDALTEPKQAVDRCLQELDALIAVMDERLKDCSPSLSNLHAAIEDAQRMVASLLPRSVVVPDASSPSTGPAESTGAAPVPVAKTQDFHQLIGAREDVYGQLTRAAETLAQLEPHSPIPYLVRRAVELGKLPFPQLMQQLIREERILADLQREFGLSASNSPTVQA